MGQVDRLVYNNRQNQHYVYLTFRFCNQSRKKIILAFKRLKTFHNTKYSVIGRAALMYTFDEIHFFLGGGREGGMYGI